VLAILALVGQQPVGGPSRIDRPHATARAASAATTGATASPCNYFADPHGRKGGAGSSGDPVSSAQELVELLEPGEVGCLRDGVYEGGVTFRRGGTHMQPVTLTSAPGSSATLQGVVWVARTASDVVLRGLRLDGSTTNGAPSPQVNGSRVTLAANNITNGHTAICLILGGDFRNYGIAHRSTVKGNRIHDCGRLPATNHDHGIYIEGARGVQVSSNSIYDNADWGIHLFPNAKHVVIRHNVVFHNGRGIIIAGNRHQASSDNVVEDNIIGGSTLGSEVSTFWDGMRGEKNLVTRNCLWNDAHPTIGDHRGMEVRGNDVRRPHFVDEPGGDFRSAPDDPCSGRGLGPAG